MNGKTFESKLATLTQRIDAEHAIFKEAVAAIVHAALAEYGLTLNDLVAPAKPPKTAKVARKKKAAKKAAPTLAVKVAKRKPPFKGPQPPKYADPNTGATWSGLGKPPAWIAGANDRTPFLISGA
jgi:DNA-binding protein H-NS